MLFKLKADYILKDVTEIDIEELKQKGLKGLIFDLDNTIMAPHTGTLNENIEHWFESAKQNFRIAIVSNNPDKEYLDKVYKVVNCPIYGKAKKPRRKIIRKAVSDMQLNVTEIAVIGDRPLTDIWVGKRLGAHTILVDPLIKHQEHKFIKFLRKIERTFIDIPKI